MPMTAIMPLSPSFPMPQTPAHRRIEARRNGADSGEHGRGDGHPCTRALVKHLATMINWVRADEQAKHNPGQSPPPFLIVLLGQMGLLHKRCPQTGVAQPAA
jgi:hypothetical protein